MAGRGAELAMMLLGLASAALLIAYGVLAAGTTPNAALFWVIVAAFLVYIFWDVARHLRAKRRRTQRPGGRTV